MWAYDGRGPGTSLTPALLAAWNCASPELLLDQVYLTPIPRDRIAALARIVAEVAQRGDPVCASNAWSTPSVSITNS